MKVGVAFNFQNLGEKSSDAAMLRAEYKLADMVEPLGFDSLFTTEHHFTRYQIAPSPHQFLSYMAGRTKRIELGTCATILPWHDPIRVAEEVTLLDILSDGRAILGIGRGLGLVEFDGFRVPMSESRERFLENAQVVLHALETGKLKQFGKHYPIPDRDLRPVPIQSFKNRTYAAAVSPESFDTVVELGLGLMCVVQKPWDTVRADFARYREMFLARHARPAPKALSVAFIFCDHDAERAKDYAAKYIDLYYHETLAHYDLTGDHFAKTPGYEYYKTGAQTMKNAGEDKAAAFFRNLQVFGTPKQCIEKIIEISELLDAEHFAANVSYGGMPYEDAEKNLKLYAAEVAPKVQAYRAQKAA